MEWGVHRSSGKSLAAEHGAGKSAGLSAPKNDMMVAFD